MRDNRDMVNRVRFDVYGRFRVTAEQNEDAAWAVYRDGSDGKRGRMTDVVVPEDATLDEVERVLEAMFHELARPGTSIMRIDC